MTYTIYQNKVLLHYKLNSENGNLGIKWLKPTPAFLKEELTSKLKTGKIQNEKDLKTIKEFLKIESVDQLEETLRKLDTDLFLPVIYFLRGKTKNPNAIYIEILAILVDYHPRPFSFDLKMEPNVDEPEENESENRNPIKILKEGNFIKKLIYPLLILIGAGGWWQASIQKDCMYWNNYEYIECACSLQLPNQEVIALNKLLLNNFKRLKNIKEYQSFQIEHLWYTKITLDSLDVFTMDGKHPLNKKELKPVSRYIFEKYMTEN